MLNVMRCLANHNNLQCSVSSSKDTESFDRYSKVFLFPRTSIEAVRPARLNLRALCPARQTSVEYRNYRALQVTIHSLAARIMATTTLGLVPTLVEPAHTYAVQ